ncbi:MAG TPA: BA14K family protein [Candidatus Cybelea sp.]|nr:BA14K family protein [Candidatus Cybelea sp.]
MRKHISNISLAALLALGGLGGIATAVADPAQDKVISTYCNKNTDAPDCNDWRYNRASWSAEKYQSFYSKHQSDPDFQAAEADAASGPPVNTTAAATDANTGTAPLRDPLGTAAIAAPVTPTSNTPAVSPASSEGTVTSTPTGSVVNTVPEVIGDSPNHVADCQATFKSYDPATDTYMGLDGQRQKCKL